MKLRSHQDMQADPKFPFMVGRMVGACEAAAILLRSGKLAANELCDLGVKLDEVASWFLDKEQPLPVERFPLERRPESPRPKASK